MCRQVRGEKKTVEENEGEGGVRLRLKGEGWFKYSARPIKSFYLLNHSIK
jgi:hypothetical protein